MPRRLPVRPSVIIGNMFVVLVFWLIGLIYYAYTFLVWLPKAEDDWRVILLLAVFHVIFFMMLWSFIQSMTTDPGQVPVFWGFHLGDPENKRRRYCLMCNIFKPERCHHCSSCNRCVLNMDHHCPWINNCIGFWNRKFFILLLIYVLILTYYIAFTMAFAWIESIQWCLDTYYFARHAKDQEILIKNLIIQVAFMFNGVIAILMTMFLRFHIGLALSNKTTIENLEMKGRPFVSAYDIGANANWEQIFGRNRLLWPLPIFWDSGKPIGEGIYWKTAKSEEERLKNEALKRQNQATSPQRTGGQAQGNRQGQSFQNSATAHQQQQIQMQQYRQGAQFASNAMPGGGGQAIHPNQRFVQEQIRQQQMMQQQMYNQSKNQVIDSRVIENQVRAAQLNEQIHRQKAKIAPQQAKNVRGSQEPGAAKKVPAQKQRARVAAQQV